MPIASKPVITWSFCIGLDGDGIVLRRDRRSFFSLRPNSRDPHDNSADGLNRNSESCKEKQQTRGPTPKFAGVNLPAPINDRPQAAQIPRRLHLQDLAGVFVDRHLAAAPRRVVLWKLHGELISCPRAQCESDGGDSCAGKRRHRFRKCLIH